MNDPLGTPAYAAVLCASLNLSTSDLAEIGGFGERHARRILRGESPLQPDVLEALMQIQQDCFALTEQLIDAAEKRGGGELSCYRDNGELREDGAMPARGNAAGGFVGPYMVAVADAMAEFGKGLVPVFD